jgi:hypothetical protein
MIYWLILVVYGTGTSRFTVTTQVMHVGNYPDLKACEAAGKNTKAGGSPDNWRYKYICVEATNGKLPPP